MTTPVAFRQWWPENITERVNQVAEKYGAKMIPKELDEAGKKLQLREIMKENSTPEDPMEEAFYMIDLATLEDQIRQWIKYLPRVRPFYAYKCNGSPVILDTLAALGTGFDCASREEFEHVLSLDQKMDAGKDIIFANPCKQVSHIKSAARNGLHYVTFDNECELPKIKKDWPDAKVVLRIVTDDSKSICEFSSKYGAQLDLCPRLIDLCKELDLDLVGVSFHIGSGCGDVSAFAQSVRDARMVFDLATQRGFTMNLLDIGGGFPGDKETKPSFQEIANVLRPVIDELFDESVQVIAEPGRYFACASHTLACNIFAKREISFKEGGEDADAQREVQYYLNEGVYQSFNCLFFDHAVVDCVPMPNDMADENNASIPKRLTTVFGPTCDGLDCIVKRIELPEMKLGDWMAFFDFGAYTISASSAFNGFKTKKFVYIRSGAGES
eukprot:TRINITY_DN1674_c0_g1_i1.p1 TRINITY_DN1674_c0_g1~~TRINITY_DN1674_c0_g1_i1.p1  ORF type:complete len:441 (+),score=186.62 TRINITY_DN1674_c0_g1_i1:245-1567(+)